MRQITIIIVLTFSARNDAKEQMASEIRDILHTWGDLMQDKRSRLSFTRDLSGAPLQHAYLDNTILGKLGHYAECSRKCQELVLPLSASPVSFLRGLSLPCAYGKSRTRVRHEAIAGRYNEFFGPQELGIHARMSPLRSSADGTSMVATTYGEICPEGLLVFAPYYRELASKVFVDLGSGEGNALLHFYSLFPETASITGIEYVQNRHDVAVANIRARFEDAPEPTSTSEYHYGPFHVYCGDFLDTRFAEIIGKASLLYLANLCFPTEVNERLSAMLRQNKGAIIVSLKKLSTLGSVPTSLRQSWNPEARAYIWRVDDDRGIQPLIKVLYEGNLDAHEEAAGSLYSLAQDSENQDEIRERGGIHALIKILREGEIKAQAKAAGALRNLAENSQNQDAIREAGGIEALIKTVREGSGDAKAEAAGALWNLNENSKNRQIIQSMLE